MFPCKGRVAACLLVSPFGRRKYEACVCQAKREYVYLSSLGIKGAVSPLGLTEGSIQYTPQ